MNNNRDEFNHKAGTLNIGEYLRTARTEKGFTLDYIEEETKIRKTYLQAIENNDFDELPGDVYAKGFLRNYAKILGLESDSIIASYRELVGEKTTEQHIEDNSEGKIRYTFNNKIIAGLLIIFLIVGVFALRGFLSRNEEEPAVDVNGQSPLESLPSEREEEEQLIGEEEVDEATGVTVETDRNDYARYLVADDSLEVEIDIKEADCWIRVTADGNIVFEELLRPGSNEVFHAESTISIIAGNPGAMGLVINGKEIESVGLSGVRKEIDVLRE